MCNPAAAMFAISTVLTVGSGVMQANAADKAGRYNAQVGENNAKIADFNAKDATLRGARAADEQRLKTRMMMGKQRASLAAQGVTLDGGSSLDLLGDTAMMGAIDEQTITMNAAREAWGYRVQADNYRSGGALDRFTGKAQKTGTLLGTAASAAGGWSNYKSGK